MSRAPVTLRSAALAFGAFSLVVGSVTLLAHFRGVSRAHAALGGDDPPAMKVAPTRTAVAVAPPFTGLDLTRLTTSKTEVVAALPNGRVAHLTLDATLQKAAVATLKQHKLPEGVIVMMDPDTGAILAYASHSGRVRDLAVEAIAPSASVFKLVTAAALVDKGATAQTRECFARSAEQRVLASDLEVDPLRDKWCMSLATAMGKSENAVFARLAHEKLDRPSLESAAHALGWGEALQFDVPVQPSKLDVPDDALGFARTAAGFWNTTLSPLHAAAVSATIARGGVAVRPHIVARITTETGQVDYEAPREPESHRALGEGAAQALTTMMEHTVSEGTSYRAFHDAHRTPFVPATVAGKTGTLSDSEDHHQAHLYTWFTGFAPSHAKPGERRVAIAVLVVNNPHWRVKANVVAREMLHEFFRDHQGAPEDNPVVAAR
jgi:cell division protein FtsI/penicillin-binding protein 2